ncbi:hypothetical protein FN846DRAFT_893358 [Sphaerosporella brunnea]|uniref:Uncharacterized protein n=1 Tax=Sphaerosporella brunnea TaxID=1250544 RepID=A0A5J5EM80_9PEZI|nr:hypothetical protein FN846DRAFT_893358 [Sphaerosporella brunnea]
MDGSPPPPRKSLYLERDRMCELLGIARGSRNGMARLRQRISQLCRQLGSPLDRSYTEWDEPEMGRLVHDVTAALNKDRVKAGGTHVLPEEAVDAVIHRMCLDNVRRVRAERKRKSSSSKVSADYVSAMAKLIEEQKPRDSPDSDGDDDSATKEPASANAHLPGGSAAITALPDALPAEHMARPAADTSPRIIEAKESPSRVDPTPKHAVPELGSADTSPSHLGRPTEPITGTITNLHPLLPADITLAIPRNASLFCVAANLASFLGPPPERSRLLAEVSNGDDRSNRYAVLLESEAQWRALADDRKVTMLRFLYIRDYPPPTAHQSPSAVGHITVTVLNPTTSTDITCQLPRHCSWLYLSGKFVSSLGHPPAESQLVAEVVNGEEVSKENDVLLTSEAGWRALADDRKVTMLRFRYLK